MRHRFRKVGFTVVSSQKKGGGAASEKQGFQCQLAVRDKQRAMGLRGRKKKRGVRRHMAEEEKGKYARDKASPVLSGVSLWPSSKRDERGERKKLSPRGRGERQLV